MARNTQFIELENMLRRDIGRSASPALGVGDKEEVRRAINRTYALLYDEYDWPHLRVVQPRRQLLATERFYDFPAEINPERVESITAWLGNTFRPLDRGIGAREYSIFDSENGVTADPAQRWEMRWTGTEPPIEIWPTPRSSEQYLEVVGTLAAPRLIEDSDVCLLDDDLVVMGASIRFLARQKSGDADVAAKEFNRRLAQMRRRKGPSPRVIMGGGEARQSNRVQITIAGR